MSEIETLELAKAYVALSNAHRSDLIKPMFNSESCYRSSAVGEYHGADDIIEMMRNFFIRFPDVHWQVPQFKCESTKVSFEFELLAHDAQTGESMERRGLEMIEFDASGCIQLLTVDAS
jgi:hypothetical protein